jgi:hypothetical protein
VDLDLDFFDDTAQMSFINNLAILLNIDSSRIRIVEISAGSVIVQTEIIPDTTYDDPDSYNATSDALELIALAELLTSPNTTQAMAEQMNMTVEEINSPPEPVLEKIITNWNSTNSSSWNSSNSSNLSNSSNTTTEDTGDTGDTDTSSVINDSDGSHNAVVESADLGLPIGLGVGGFCLVAVAYFIYRTMKKRRYEKVVKGPKHLHSHSSDDSTMIGITRDVFDSPNRSSHDTGSNSAWTPDSSLVRVNLAAFNPVDNVPDSDEVSAIVPTPEELAEIARLREIQNEAHAHAVRSVETYARFLGTMESYEIASMDPNRFSGNSRVLLEQEQFRKLQWPKLHILQQTLKEELENYANQYLERVVARGRDALSDLEYDIHVRFVAKIITVNHQTREGTPAILPANCPSLKKRSPTTREKKTEVTIRQVLPRTNQDDEDNELHNQGNTKLESVKLKMKVVWAFGSKTYVPVD